MWLFAAAAAAAAATCRRAPPLLPRCRRWRCRRCRRAALPPLPPLAAAAAAAAAPLPPPLLRCWLRAPAPSCAAAAAPRRGRGRARLHGGARSAGRRFDAAARARGARRRPPARARRAMARQLLLAVLERVVGKFVELDVDNLKVAVWWGEVQLENVAIRRDALAELGLPSTSPRYIGKLRLEIPWRALGSQPVRVTADRIFVIARRGAGRWGDATRSRREAGARRRLRTDERMRASDGRRRQGRGGRRWRGQWRGGRLVAQEGCKVPCWTTSRSPLPASRLRTRASHRAPCPALPPCLPAAFCARGGQDPRHPTPAVAAAVAAAAAAPPLAQVLQPVAASRWDHRGGARGQYDGRLG